MGLYLGYRMLLQVVFSFKKPNLAHISGAHDAKERKKKNGQQGGHLENGNN